VANEENKAAREDKHRQAARPEQLRNSGQRQRQQTHNVNKIYAICERSIEEEG